MHLILIPIIIILLIYIYKTKKECEDNKLLIPANTLFMPANKLLTPLTTPPMKSSPILIIGSTSYYTNM